MERVSIMFMARLSMEGIALGSVARLYHVGGGELYGSRQYLSVDKELLVNIIN